VRTLVAEETRLGMLVGVAVGLELARELAKHPQPKEI
jgi:Zn-dependent M28 family amino/carboxypeptidase